MAVDLSAKGGELLLPVGEFILNVDVVTDTGNPAGLQLNEVLDSSDLDLEEGMNLLVV